MYFSDKRSDGWFIINIKSCLCHLCTCITLFEFLKSDFYNIDHVFYIILLWIIIITIYVGPLLHFTSIFYCISHTFLLHFTYYNLRQFYYIIRQLLHFTSKSYCILRQYYISRNYCNLRQYRHNLIWRTNIQ